MVFTSKIFEKYLWKSDILSKDAGHHRWLYLEEKQGNGFLQNQNNCGWNLIYGKLPILQNLLNSQNLRPIMVKVRKWQLPRPQTLIIASPKMHYLIERKKSRHKISLVKNIAVKNFITGNFISFHYSKLLTDKFFAWLSKNINWI